MTTSLFVFGQFLYDWQPTLGFGLWEHYSAPSSKNDEKGGTTFNLILEMYIRESTIARSPYESADAFADFDSLLVASCSVCSFRINQRIGEMVIVDGWLCKDVLALRSWWDRIGASWLMEKSSGNLCVLAKSIRIRIYIANTYCLPFVCIFWLHLKRENSI